MQLRRLTLLALLLPALATAAERVEPKPWWTKDQFDGLAAVEAKLLELTNAQRALHKLPPLRLSPALTVAARQHSQEMLKEKYFEHESPHAEWKEPWDRAYRAGFWESTIGENIVMFSTTAKEPVPGDEVAREFMLGDHGWMNSPGHRANILSTDYEEIGIGVAGERNAFYGTQVFGRRFYELTDLALAAAGAQWVLTGKAKVLGKTARVYPAVDNQVEEDAALPVTAGQTLDFKLTLPADGARHKLGLHPERDEGTFWIKNLLFVDTAKPLNDALLMPY